MWDFFEKKLQECQEKDIPRYINNSKRKKLWVTKKVKKKSKRKYKAWKKFHNFPNSDNRENFRKIRNETTSVNRKAKLEYERKLASNIKDNPKSFYAYVQSKQNCKSCVGPLRYDNRDVDDPQKISNIINSYFASVFTAENTENVPVAESRLNGESWSCVS